MHSRGEGNRAAVRKQRKGGVNRLLKPYPETEQQLSKNKYLIVETPGNGDKGGKGFPKQKKAKKATLKKKAGNWGRPRRAEGCEALLTGRAREESRGLSESEIKGKGR